MAYRTKRAIKADLATARRCIVDMHRRAEKQAEAHDLEIRQLGRQLADRDEHIGRVEAHRDNLRAQLDVAHQGLADAKKAMAACAGVDLVKRGDP